ncbi:MAG: hypothetical protein MHPSP_001178, partial [Paramarteilia canceri]
NLKSSLEIRETGTILYSSFITEHDILIIKTDEINGLNFDIRSIDKIDSVITFASVKKYFSLEDFSNISIKLLNNKSDEMFSIFSINVGKQWFLCRY